MNINAFELIGGYINEKMFKNIDLPLNELTYTSSNGLLKSKITIGSTEYKNYFINQKIKNSENCNLYEIIIEDIDTSISSYNSGNITDRLRMIFGEKLSRANPPLHSKLIECIQKVKNGDTMDGNERAFEDLLNKEKISTDASIDNETILQRLRIKNPNAFWKLKLIIEKPYEFVKKINQINADFSSELKRLKSDSGLLANLYKEKRNDYTDVLLKVVPFFKTSENIKTVDIFKKLNDNKHVVYFKLDDILYKIYENLEAPNDLVIYYIDNEYQIEKIDQSDHMAKISSNPNSVIDKSFVKITNIIEHPDIKNILLTKKNFEQIKNTLEYMIKYFKTDPDVYGLFDYMFTYIGGEHGPKKRLVANILNLFVLTGNLTLMYQLFGKEYYSRLSQSQSKFNLMSAGSSKTTANPDYKITAAQLKIRDLPNKQTEPVKYCEKVNSIISQLKETELEKILLDKFKIFIKFNESWLDNQDDNFTSLIKGLNNIEYEGIPDDIISILDKIKTKLLVFLIDSRDQITEEMTASLSSGTSSGINLVNSYNFYDLLDNCKELDNKISGYKSGDSISDIENQVSTVNNIILRKREVIWYFLFLEVVNFRRIIHRAAEKLGYNGSVNFHFASYLIDIFTVYRIKQELDVPFNINLLTHKFNGLRETNITIDSYKRRQLKTIYDYFEENFACFSYGRYSRNTADCAETVILNLINFLIWDEDEQSLRYDWLPENTIEVLKEFYKKNNKFTSFNSETRSNFDELFYGFEFTMQNLDFYTTVDPFHDNYKVYSVPEIVGSVPDGSVPYGISSLSDALIKYIYGEDGNLKPGEREIKYSGWRIRPNYISFVRLFNKVFGYDKISDKYNENHVMRTTDLYSLKEILLTFKNPKIQEILSDYKISGGNLLSDETTFSFNKMTIELLLYHGISTIMGSHDPDSSGLTDTLSILYQFDRNLRFYMDSHYISSNINDIEDNPEKLLVYNTETLRNIIELRFEKCLERVYPISNKLIQVYKSIWAPEQTHLVLKKLPSDKYFDTYPISSNNLLNEFRDKIKLSEEIYANSHGSINESIMEFIIYINKNNINAELDKFGNRLIHVLIRYNHIKVIDKCIERNADFNLTDVFGNNILHICKYIVWANYNNLILTIKCALKKKTGNDLAFNKLVMEFNKSGYYPFVDILKKKSIDVDILLPLDEQGCMKVIINFFSKLYKKDVPYKRFFRKFTEINKIIMERFRLKLITQDFLDKFFSFVINITIKSRRTLKGFIKIMKATGLFDMEEIYYLKCINYYKFRKEYSYYLNESTIIKSLKFGKKYYEFNPWTLFNKFDTSPVTFNIIQTILTANSLESEFNKLGQIEDTQTKGLIDQITGWAAKQANFNTILERVDSDSNTLIHYLALGFKINLKKSSSYLKVFKSLIDKGRFDLLTMPNNKGWSPIDILAYIPKYPNKVFLENLEGVRDQFKILINFYTKFSGDISNHKIILLRYMIESVFVNITQRVYKQVWVTSGTAPTKQLTFVKGERKTEIKNLKEVDDLITLLNTKLIDPDVTNQMLSKVNKEFNLHEYLPLFGKTARTNNDTILEKYSFRDYLDKEVDGKRKDDRNHTLFFLSNKSTLNHIPTRPIECVPKLEITQLKKIGDHNYLNNLTKKFINNFIKTEFRSEISEVPELDPAIKKLEPDVLEQTETTETTETDGQEDFIPEIGLEDFVKPYDTQEPPASSLTTDLTPELTPESTQTKYLIQEKDYAKLYLKYKQKYISLKNKMNRN